MVSKLALGAIWGYQRYVSPYKGFRCAHSVLHGGTGCSGYAKHAIRDLGIWRAIPSIRQRFRDCRAASDALRANCPVHANWAEGQAMEQGGGSPRRGDKRRKNTRGTKGDGCVGSACDCGDYAFCGLALPAFCVAGRAAGAQPTSPDKTGTPPDGGGTGGSGTEGGGADGCGGTDCSTPSCDGGCNCTPSCQ